MGRFGLGEVRFNRNLRLVQKLQKVDSLLLESFTEPIQMFIGKEFELP
jgi:hypothetical protein